MAQARLTPDGHVRTAVRWPSFPWGAVLGVVLVGVGVVAWSGAQAHALSMESALSVIRTEGDDAKVRSASVAAFTHADRAIDALHSLAAREDQVGRDAQIMLDRLHERTRRR